MTSTIEQMIQKGQPFHISFEEFDQLKYYSYRYELEMELSTTIRKSNLGEFDFSYQKYLHHLHKSKLQKPSIDTNTEMFLRAALDYKAYTLSKMTCTYEGRVFYFEPIPVPQSLGCKK